MARATEVQETRCTTLESLDAGREPDNRSHLAEHPELPGQASYAGRLNEDLMWGNMNIGRGR
jgi:hypothetical protein